MSFQTLKLTEADDRTTVELDRPDKRNAIDQEMVDELHQVCARLEQDPKLLLIAGGDGIFASGADIAQLRDRDRFDALRAINASLFERIRKLPLPTVAAVDGLALGGGAELAYTCDVRICTDRARFGQPEVLLGIIPGAGATHRLPQLVGESLAKELLFTGRRISAAEAREARLVSKVIAEPADLLPAAHSLLDDMAKASPLALRLAKLAVDAPPDAHPQVDLIAQAVLFEDDDKHRRMTDFLEKREKRKPR
ncbi:MAG: enoyl-CoA hydratase/isomerase family protein [Stackebrandtia sp.]